MIPRACPRVAIIVLNWNAGEDILACLRSLQTVTYPEYEVVVVDNASTDGSTEQVQALFPRVTLLQTGSNAGFVGGNNFGLEYAQEHGFAYALLLNNDTEVAGDFLDPLVHSLEADPSAGIAGPAIYYFSEPEVFWSAGGAIDHRRGITRMVAIGETDHGQFGPSPREVDFVTGCALLIKMPLVGQIGPLDPRFFAYYEETEWCVRARTHGYRCLHVPASKVWHKISPQAREASPVVHYYMTRNRLLFLKLTGAGLPALAGTLWDYARTLLSWTIKPRWRGKKPQRDAMLRAILDFYSGRFGRADVR